MLLITAWAVPVGGLGALASFALLRLIGLITNLVFYQRWRTALVAPGAVHHPWWLILAAPVAGGLAVGVIARYGSEKIRGHGMPEAIEAILTRGAPPAAPDPSSGPTLGPEAGATRLRARAPDQRSSGGTVSRQFMKPGRDGGYHPSFGMTLLL